MAEPDSTAARVALWRALHVELDAPPHVLRDEVGLELLAPPAGWRARGDMHAQGTAPFRASIVARARFLEDLVTSQPRLAQYVILGAGLDSFAQRVRQAGLQIFEIDRPGPQQWKRERLQELGYGLPSSLHFVPVDFEAQQDWLAELERAGFDRSKPSVVASTGVSMYLTKEANMETLRKVAALPSASFVMSFLLPLEMAEEQARPGLEMSARGARNSGTPFISYFPPSELTAMARTAGFREAHHVSAKDLTQRYFADRKDGLRPPYGAEELLVATT